MRHTITRHGFKRGKCQVCGGSAERSQKFVEAFSPNTGQTEIEAARRANESRRAWEAEPVVHKRCEGRQA